MVLTWVWRPASALSPLPIVALTAALQRLLRSATSKPTKQASGAQSGAERPPLDLVLLTADPLPLGSLASEVVCPSAGGIATFIGTTRDHFEGRKVLRLEVRHRRVLPYMVRVAHRSAPLTLAYDRCAVRGIRPHGGEGDTQDNCYDAGALDS